jgi:hypothetical protein
MLTERSASLKPFAFSLSSEVGVRSRRTRLKQEKNQENRDTTNLLGTLTIINRQMLSRAPVS